VVEEGTKSKREALNLRAGGRRRRREEEEEGRGENVAPFLAPDRSILLQRQTDDDQWPPPPPPPPPPPLHFPPTFSR